MLFPMLYDTLYSEKKKKNTFDYTLLYAYAYAYAIHNEMTQNIQIIISFGNILQRIIRYDNECGGRFHVGIRWCNRIALLARLYG